MVPVTDEVVTETSIDQLRTVIADVFAEHWWGPGGCCCRKMEGVEHTYHLADLVLSKLNATGFAICPTEDVN